MIPNEGNIGMDQTNSWGLKHEFTHVGPDFRHQSSGHVHDLVFVNSCLRKWTPLSQLMVNILYSALYLA